MVQYYQYPFVNQQPMTVVPQPVPAQGFDFGAVPSLPPAGGSGIQLPFIEQSYIENILRMNKGKEATVYMNFENSQFGSKIFKGVIEAAGKDHIILSDSETGMRYLLPMIWLNYITFDEEIDYDYPIAQVLQNIQEQTPQQQTPQAQAQVQPQPQTMQQQPVQQQYSYSQSQTYQRDKSKQSQKKK